MEVATAAPMMGAEISLADAGDGLMARAEERRQAVGRAISPARRAELGQFFTPAPAAALIAGMPRLPQAGTLRVLDAGAGTGSLTAALAARALREAPELRLEVTGLEIDPALLAPLNQTLDDCAAAAPGRFAAGAVAGDLLADPAGPPYDLVLMNPPYRKLNASAAERQLLAARGVDCPNLYCVFAALGLLALRPGGQLAAITPRSFASGPYFAGFRRFLLGTATLDGLHVFESRAAAFADAGVLQENIIIGVTRNADAGREAQADPVRVSASHGPADGAVSRLLPAREIVRPGDPAQILRVPAGQDDDSAARAFARLTCRLADLELEVSTGKVVDFRAREHLRPGPGPGAVPLIYPANLRAGTVQWPRRIRKPQALADCEETRKLMLPAERYVLVKRFSAKEERRRVVAVIYEPGRRPERSVGFENHLNVFHAGGRGLDADLARGLCLWLNSSIVDRHFRTLSGHTQVNAADLRGLLYPSRDQLAALGATLRSSEWPGQARTDALVAAHVLGPASRRPLNRRPVRARPQPAL